MPRLIFKCPYIQGGSKKAAGVSVYFGDFSGIQIET